jgi:hypothetical protein
MAKKIQVAAAHAPVANVFDNAPVVATKPLKVGKSQERMRIVLSSKDKLDKFAAICVVMKSLEGEAKVIESEVKDEVRTIFAKQAILYKKHPDSFVGVGDRATASCELRRRGSNMPITADLVAILEENNIPVGKNEKVPERFVFNPDLDQADLVYIGQLLAADPKLRGKQIVMKQQEQSTFVVTEDSLTQLALCGDESFIASMYEKLCTTAVGKFALDNEAIEQNKCVTPDAKAAALATCVEMGLFPSLATVAAKTRKRA